ANPEAKDSFLAALFLPHVKIRIEGGAADFPALQYAAAKERYLGISDETDRLAEASRRLYGFCQSGCIATEVPGDPTRVILTTFGIFDTPRDLPLPGPDIRSLTENPNRFLELCDHPSAALASWIVGHWTDVRGILLAASEAFGLESLHRFQWDAIQAN